MHFGPRALVSSSLHTLTPSSPHTLVPSYPRTFLLVLFMLVPSVALAQDAATGDRIPRNEEAELIFEQGVEAFEQGDYGMAYRRFRLVTNTHALNLKTTAAVLMAGKALYRQGEFERAEEILGRFIQTYPTSSYVGEAEETLRFAREQMTIEGERRDVVNLGVLLPLGADDAALTQALFNGIRLAVEDFNAQNEQGVTIRMIFEDSGGDPARTREAVMALADQTSVILGPLYSEEAAAGAEAAEEEKVVMIAPLATDDAVSEGKRYVFQANPTLATRGRLVADFAMRNLRLRRFGVVAERSSSAISEKMAESFQEETMRQGAEVAFFKLLPSARSWVQLREALEGDEEGENLLGEVDALYLPVSGDDAVENIQAALRELERTGADVRVLGNAEWDDLPSKLLASMFQTTYSNDFYVDEQNPDVRAFANRYEALTGTNATALDVNPRRLAFTGYDLAQYVLAQISGGEGEALASALRAAPPYQGLGIRLDFSGSNVNQAMYFFRYRAGRLEVLR